MGHAASSSSSGSGGGSTTKAGKSSAAGGTISMNMMMMMMPIISKIYCSAREAVLVVRRRPAMVGGGGFVVMNSRQEVVFKVEGCGILGKKGELILRDAIHGDPLILIRQKGGIVQALSLNKKWNGYVQDYEGTEELVFCIKQEAKACLAGNNAIKISIDPSRGCGRDNWEFQIRGHFPHKNCTIVDSHGKILAQIGMKEDMEKVMDVYYVVVQPGIDQAFVSGVIAVLDYIHGESTRC
ncbi:hypothetical protein Dimus_002511 [Dionaea muscipula]